MPGTNRSTSKRAAGRPSEISGKAVHVYLDMESLAVAATLGNGNVSAGIRVAIADAKKNLRNLQKNS